MLFRTCFFSHSIRDRHIWQYRYTNVQDRIQVNSAIHSSLWQDWNVLSLNPSRSLCPVPSGPIQSVSPWMESSGLHLRSILTVPSRSCLFIPRHLLYSENLSPEIGWIHQPQALPLAPLWFLLQTVYSPCHGVFLTLVSLPLGFDLSLESQVVSNRAIFIQRLLRSGEFACFLGNIASPQLEV